MTMGKYFRPDYRDYRNSFYKQAAQPPAGDPMAGGMPPGGMPMDAAMMGGMPPGGMPMDMGMMAGGAPPMDQSMMGGMPMDASMMAPPPAAPPAADPAAAAADPAASPKSAKQQKEDLMNGIQAALDDIKDYTYNNLMILIKIANQLGVQIPAETLVAPPDGKNMDIMTDPAAISAAAGAGGPPAPTGGMPPMPPDAGAMPPEMAGMPGPADLPPAEAAPSEVKTSMYHLVGIPEDLERKQQIKNAMYYIVNKDRAATVNKLSSLINR